MPADGCLTITAVPAISSAKDYPAELEGQSAIALTVADTGTGMPPEVLAKVMEPFFTTKGPGKGTGLGLAMVHGFVMQSGGAMRIYSAPGQGTSITLYLLTSTASQVPSVPAPGTGSAKNKTRRILVVDDDPAVRALVAAQLEELGHQVETASGAAQALEMLHTSQAGKAKVQLVVSDVMMPVTDGCELARRVRETWPALPVLFMTGQTEDPRLKNEPLIAKPFNLAALAAALQSVEPRGPMRSIHTAL